MALQYKVVSFVSPASASTTSVTGVGFTPKGFIFFGVRTPGTQGLPFALRVGVDDLTNRFGRAINGGQFAGGNFGDAYIDNAHSIVAMRTQAINELMIAAYVSAVNADGFDVTWDTVVVATGVRFYAIVFGGTGVNVKAGISTFTAGTTTAVNTVGFTPTAVFGFEMGQNAAIVLPDGCSLSMGFAGAVACGQVTISGGFSSTAGAVSKAYGYQAEDEWISVVDQANGNIVRKNVLQSLDASGFTVNNVTGGGIYAWLAINGCAINVGTFTQNTASGPQAVSLIAGSPKMAVLFSANKGASATATTDALFSIGAGYLTPAYESEGVFSGALAGYSAANQHTYNVEEQHTIGQTYVITGDATGTLGNDVALSSFTNGQMGLNWSLSDGDGRSWAYAVFADASAQACGAQAAGSINVIKNTTPIPGGDTEFTFTTTGGLSPSTFTLIDGESQQFTSLANGTYGVTEVPLAGWTTSYSVSKPGSTHDAIVIASDAVTVTVTNTFGSATSQLLRLRRWALPYDGNKKIFIPRIEIIAQMGVGNDDDPDPVMYLRISPDGGSNFGPWRQLPLGADGDTTIRAYLTRFCQGLRNPVAELVCAAPVFVAWVACELPQGFTVGTS